jgi:ATP synthase protein I
MNPDSPIPTRAALVRPAIATAVVGVLGVVWGALVAGTAGVIAAVMATVVVLAFFALGQLAVQKVLASNPALGLFILLAALRNATFFDPRVFAGTIVACALVWTAMIVVSLSKRPSAYVEPESTLGLSDDPEVIARLRKDGS